MTKACIVPWQSIRVCTDGSVAPCCNSDRKLSSYAERSEEGIWNSKQSEALRSEILSRDFDTYCSTCIEQNTSQPEDVISKVYTSHSVPCETDVEGGEPLPFAADCLFLNRAKAANTGAENIHEKIEIAENILTIGDSRYLIGSDRTSCGEIEGKLDQCIIAGSVLKCRGWAFDKRRNRVPSRFLVFLQKRYLGTVSPIGERYDVAKAMASGVAIKSGFTIRFDLRTALDFNKCAEIQVIALFEESWMLFRSGRGGTAVALAMRLSQRISKAIMRGMHHPEPIKLVKTGQNWRTNIAWLTVCCAPHYAHSIGTARAKQFFGPANY